MSLKTLYAFRVSEQTVKSQTKPNVKTYPTIHAAGREILDYRWPVSATAFGEQKAIGGSEHWYWPHPEPSMLAIMK